MEDLIKALQIFWKYTSDEFPTSCTYNIFWVHVNPSIVSSEDKIELARLGFYPEENTKNSAYSMFVSHRFGLRE